LVRSGKVDVVINIVRSSRVFRINLLIFLLVVFEYQLMILNMPLKVDILLSFVRLQYPTHQIVIVIGDLNAYGNESVFVFVYNWFFHFNVHSLNISIENITIIFR